MNTNKDETIEIKENLINNTNSEIKSENQSEIIVQVLEKRNSATSFDSKNSRNSKKRKSIGQTQGKRKAVKDVLMRFAKRLIILVDLFGWAFIVIPLGAAIGFSCGLFLFALNWLTRLRFANPWLLFLLPISGIIQAILYKSALGSNVGGGIDLILEEIYIGNGSKKKVIPLRMGPLAVLCTLLSHVCGASVGREGTGLQIGASLGSAWIYLLKMITKDRFPAKKVEYDILMIASLGAAFGGIFGTPLAGSVFALEVLNIGKVTTDKFLPTLLCSIMADFIGRLTLSIFNMEHSEYVVTDWPKPFDYRIIGLVLVVGIFSGWVAFLFAFLTKTLKKGYEYIAGKIALIGPQKYQDNKIFIASIVAVIGGGLVIAMRYIFQTEYYLGIGTIMPPNDPNFVIIDSFFDNPSDPIDAFILKLLFTSVSIGAGYKGGEVTNLFFMGAALGNAVGQMFGRHYSFYAALGLASVFSGATNTPLSCTLLGLELFGSNFTVLFGLSSFVAYIVAGWSGVYSKQKVVAVKLFPILNTEYNKHPHIKETIIEKEPKNTMNIEKAE